MVSFNFLGHYVLQCSCMSYGTSKSCQWVNKRVNGHFQLVDETGHWYGADGWVLGPVCACRPGVQVPRSGGWGERVWAAHSKLWADLWGWGAIGAVVERLACRFWCRHSVSCSVRVVGGWGLVRVLGQRSWHAEHRRVFAYTLLQGGRGSEEGRPPTLVRNVDRIQIPASPGDKCHSPIAPSRPCRRREKDGRHGAKRSAGPPLRMESSS